MPTALLRRSPRVSTTRTVGTDVPCRSPRCRSPRGSFGRFLAAAAVPLAGAASCVLAADWQPGGTLPDAKQHAYGVLHQGTIYSIGGTPWVNGGDQDGTVFKSSGSGWTTAPSLDGMGSAIPVGGGVDGLGRIVIFGGIALDNGDTGKNKVYDPVDGPQGSIADPSDFVQQLGFAFAADDLGRLYWLGGGPGAAGGNSAWCERYVAATNTWSPVAALPMAVADACACFDGSGHILVFGGFGPGGTRINTVQRYDVAANTWSTSAVPPLPVAVSGARAVLGADDRVYVIGGVVGAGAGTVTNVVQTLGLATNAWSMGPSLATARHQFAAVRGADDFIYAIGGTSAAGTGLADVEKMFTSICPEIPGPTVELAVWTTQTAVVPAPVSGSLPMDFAWSKDGAPIVDGPTGTGSTIAGATTATLTIEGTGSADAGAYGIVATNDCGTTMGVVANLEIRTPPAIPTQWTVTNLHPEWATTSVARAVSGNQQAGSVTTDTPEYLNLSGPVVWTGSAASVVSMTPPGSVGGAISDLEDGIAVGWWWWPYQCYVSGQWYTCYSKQAAMWIDGPGGFDNLQASGWEYSAASVVRDGVVGGTITTDDEVGNVWSHGGVWKAPNYFFTDLHPGSVASSSSVTALDGDHQFGGILTPYPGPTYHAAMWTGTAASFVDLHPGGVSASGVVDAADGQQVGITGYYTDGKACMWTGTPQSYRSLHPAGAVRSGATACSQGVQLGFIVLDSVDRPVLWTGEAESYVDLSAFVPEGFASAAFNDLQIDEDGTFTLVGSGYNTATERTEALMWTSASSVPSDLDGDGTVGGADLGLLLGAWGPCAGGGACAADLNGDGVVDGADLGALLAAWS